METGFKDSNGDMIKVGDTLLNPMMQDLWLVEEKDGMFTANLVPNSGFIKHPNNNYPQYIEKLEDVCEVFEIFKTV